MRASSQCSEAPEQHQEPTGTGAQRARVAAILDVKEEDQFDELELALEKASGNFQEELKRSSAPVLPRGQCQSTLLVQTRMFENCSFHQFPFIVMKYYEAKATTLCGACANYNPDLGGGGGGGMIGHSRPVAYGPRALKRPRAIRDWSGMADHAPALGLDCISHQHLFFGIAYFLPVKYPRSPLNAPKSLILCSCVCNTNQSKAISRSRSIPTLTSGIFTCGEKLHQTQTRRPSNAPLHLSNGLHAVGPGKAHGLPAHTLRSNQRASSSEKYTY